MFTLIHHVELTNLKNRLKSTKVTNKTKLKLEKTNHFMTGRKDPGKGIVLIKSNISYGDEAVLRVFVND